MEQYANASPNERIHIIDRDSKTTLYEVDEDAFTSFNYAEDNIICVGSVLTFFFSLKKKYCVFLRTRETVNNSRTYFALVGICQGHSPLADPNTDPIRTTHIHTGSNWKRGVKFACKTSFPRMTVKVNEHAAIYFTGILSKCIK